MNEIRAFLLSSRDESYAAFQRKLLPDVENIVGVRMPLVRGYVKQALKDGRRKSWPLSGTCVESLSNPPRYGYFGRARRRRSTPSPSMREKTARSGECAPGAI